MGGLAVLLGSLPPGKVKVKMEGKERGRRKGKERAGASGGGGGMVVVKGQVASPRKRDDASRTDDAQYT